MPRNNNPRGKGQGGGRGGGKRKPADSYDDALDGLPEEDGDTLRELLQEFRSERVNRRVQSLVRAVGEHYGLEPPHDTYDVSGSSDDRPSISRSNQRGRASRAEQSLQDNVDQLKSTVEQQRLQFQLLSDMVTKAITEKTDSKLTVEEFTSLQEQAKAKSRESTPIKASAKSALKGSRKKPSGGLFASFVAEKATGDARSIIATLVSKLEMTKDTHQEEFELSRECDTTVKKYASACAAEHFADAESISLLKKAIQDFGGYTTTATYGHTLLASLLRYLCKHRIDVTADELGLEL